MANWVDGYGDFIPDGAVVLGNESNGVPLFAARANYSGGLHPGKVRFGFGAANIPYGGKEIKVNPYQVLVGPTKWVAADKGAIPQKAIVAGHESDGNPLYVARAQYNGGLHIGKIRPGFNGANIPYGGNEVTVASYEVLVSE